MNNIEKIKFIKILNNVFPKESKIKLKLLPLLWIISSKYNYQIGIYKNNKIVDTFFYPVDKTKELIKCVK